MSDVQEAISSDEEAKVQGSENSCCSKQFGLSVTVVHSVMTVITALILTTYVLGPHLGSARGLLSALSLHILTEVSRGTLCSHASCVLHSAAVVCALLVNFRFLAFRGHFVCLLYLLVPSFCSLWARSYIPEEP